MAGYTYENLLPHEPVIIYTALDGWNDPANLAASDEEGNEMIRTVAQPIFWVLDISHIDMDITTMIMLANKYTRSEITRGEASMWQHSNVRQLIAITSDDLIQQMASGMQSDLFGSMDIKVFASRDDMLAYVRSQTQ